VGTVYTYSTDMNINVSSPISTTTISTTTTTENPTTVFSPTEVNGTMFWFVKRKLNYGEAIINCNENGGKLFEPRNAGSNFWVYQMARAAFDNVDRIWIGINDIEMEGRYDLFVLTNNGVSKNCLKTFVYDSPFTFSGLSTVAIVWKLSTRIGG
jgi:hypothetical protein